MAQRNKRTPMKLGDEGTWRRLGELLIARRGELGYKHRPQFWRERVEHRGLGDRLSERTITDLENNYRPGTFLPATLGLVAAVYDVDYDSMTAVLRGGQVDRLEPGHRGPEPAGDLAGGPGWPPIGDKQRIADAQPYADEIWARLITLAARGITDPAGEQLFPRDDEAADARAWDRWAADLWPVRDRVWLAADTRRDQAQRRNGGNSRPRAS